LCREWKNSDQKIEMMRKLKLYIVGDLAYQEKKKNFENSKRRSAVLPVRRKKKKTRGTGDGADRKDASNGEK